jgi:hypothetical protein
LQAVEDQPTDDRDSLLRRALQSLAATS